jgi:polyhydroxyalkanoate synthesis repressor PhaR
MVQSRRARSGSENASEDGAAKAEAGGVRVLKKYPNRRLYDTLESSYITLADVKKMVLAGQEFVVRDARSSEDLTRSILLQIILEEETGGLPMFSSQTLAQIIRFYGHAMQGVMGSYLEKNMQAFAEMQSRLLDPGKAMSPELWKQFMNGQAPAMSGLMTNYLEQSQAIFQQMQDQMAKQTEAMLQSVPGYKPPKA